LDIPSQDGARAALLQQNVPTLDLSKVYLVVNNNAPMSPGEEQVWINANVAKFFVGNPNPPKGTVDPFTPDVTALANSQPTPTGLVISADPYFRLSRTALIKAIRANNTLKNIPVCYPFREFADARHGYSLVEPQLSLPVATSNSADIKKTAYYQLGFKAGQYLLKIGTNTGVVTWSSNLKKWDNLVTRRSRAKP
jgi:hypothetical protein